MHVWMIDINRTISMEEILLISINKIITQTALGHVKTVSPVLEEDEDTVDDPDPLLMQLDAVSHASYLTTPSHIKVDLAKVREDGCVCEVLIHTAYGFILAYRLCSSNESASRGEGSW